MTSRIRGKKQRVAIPFPAAAAMRRAAARARKVARQHGTPIYFIRDGKIVAEKP